MGWCSCSYTITGYTEGEMEPTSKAGCNLLAALGFLILVGGASLATIEVLRALGIL